MPVITINTHSNDDKLDLKVITKDISAKSGFEIERLTLMAQYYEQEELYSVGKSQILVHIEVCERNGKEAIQKLMESTQSALTDFAKLSKEKVTVYCHPIPDGCLLINDKYI